MIEKIKGLRRTTAVTAVGGCALLVFAAVALAGSSFKNGNFETGDFTKWTTDQHGAGDWFVSTKKIAPLSGNSWNGPAEKEWAALTDQLGPSANILYRDIKIGKKTTRVSFVLYYKNHAGFFCSQGDLDETNPCNQEYRVDIIDPSADPWTMDPGDIWKTLFETSSSSPSTMGPTRMNFNLKGLSGLVRLRFAEVDTEDYFNASVDDVKVNNG